MKRFLMVLVCVSAALAVQAQDSKDDDGEPSGFRKDMLFTGGNINIGYYSGVTVLGATPQLGYSVANWLDAGIVFGYTYSSQHDGYGNTFRQSILGPGAFVRLFPIDFLFATAQYEHNFMRQKIIYPGGSNLQKYQANSLLLGLGYTSGKEGRNTPYYYLSISIDVLGSPYSPYRDVAVSDPSQPPTGSNVVYNDFYPVIKAGFNIPLFQGSGRRRR